MKLKYYVYKMSLDVYFKRELARTVGGKILFIPFFIYDIVISVKVRVPSISYNCCP